MYHNVWCWVKAVNVVDSPVKSLLNKVAMRRNVSVRELGYPKVNLAHVLSRRIPYDLELRKM